jgi:hypothetical protein
MLYESEGPKWGPNKPDDRHRPAYFIYLFVPMVEPGESAALFFQIACNLSFRRISYMRIWQVRLV